MNKIITRKDMHKLQYFILLEITQAFCKIMNSDEGSDVSVVLQHLMSSALF